MYFRLRAFIQHPFFKDSRVQLALWIIILPIIAWLKYSLGRCGRPANNFEIFRQVFWHTYHQLPLYIHYPNEYTDQNHYGVFFSMVVAPFALVPRLLGLILWLSANGAFVYFAVKKLKLNRQTFLYWFCANELLTALYMQQFNVAIAACIIIAFAFVEDGKDQWATFFILLGGFVKIYSFGAFAFFLFSRKKEKFVVSAIVWSVLFFILPMLISSSHYVIDQYWGWLGDLSDKNNLNQFSAYTNISLLGMVRKISRCTTYSDLYLIAMGLVIFAAPLLRFSQYKHVAFRRFILSSVLMFVVLFSTGSESSGYIIALLGVAIWYVSASWERSKWDVGLMIFAFVLTSLSATDLFPHFVRAEIIRPYALKALPCILIWFKMSYELLTKDFGKTELIENQSPISS
jgi:hypothetical protein